MKRIGMITPSSNTCIEPVTAAMVKQLAEAVTVHYTRIPVRHLTMGSDSRAQFSRAAMLEAASLLADAQVDSIIWNGTSGSWIGTDADRDLCNSITAETGIVAGTATLALLETLALFGIQRVGVAVPYVSELMDMITSVYASADVTCVSKAVLNLTDNLEIGRLSMSEVRSCICAAASPEAEGIAVVCTNFGGAQLVGELEAELRVPIFDSVSVSLWKGLCLAGVHTPLFGWGTVLESGIVRASFDEILSDLRRATHGIRTTLRLDMPKLGFQVNAVCSESCSHGVKSLRNERSLDQWKLDTVQWMVRSRQSLIQPDLHSAPHAPKALIETYGVRAQMLFPIIREQQMTGWLSLHSDAERPWTRDDVAVATETVAAVHAILDSVDVLRAKARAPEKSRSSRSADR